MRTFLEIYFSINLFISTYWLGDQSCFADTKKRKIMLLVKWLFNVFFLIPKLLLGALWGLLLIVWSKVPYYDTINFYLAFYCTRQYYNLSSDVLQTINKNAVEHTGDDYRDRMWRRGMRMINRRNNYTYVAPIAEEEELAKI